MFLDVLSLVLGIGLAAFGGELFVRGLVGVSAWARIPAAVIGATVAAFATSSPELTVAINAAAEGRPEIALGDALGSNMVNIGLVVGILLLMGATKASDLNRRDALTGLALVGLLALMVIDGKVARTDGLVLILCFSVWLALVVRQAARTRDAHIHEGAGAGVVETLGERLHGRSIVESLIGLVFLIAAGRLLVVGAKGIGLELGLSTFVVGVVLVSFGTSLPELATGVISKVRGHAELGLGAVLGSNIFNVGFIVAVAAILSPIDVERGDVWVSIFLGAAMLPVLFVHTGERLSRWRGVVLLGIYFTGMAVLIALET